VGLLKSKWNDIRDKLILIQGWARDGLTDEQIANNLGIGTSTLYRWKNEHRELREALKKGKEVADREVENALYKSALGFKYKEQVVTNKGNIVEVEKYEKPNTTAAIFWLKNRKPGQWRDKQEIEHNCDVGVKIIDDIPSDE
jgi:transposase-like protein